MTRLLIISLTFCFISLAHSSEKVQTLRWGINLEPLHYFIPAARHFKRQVEKKTKGRVLVELKIGEYKQDARDHLKDVQAGKYDMSQDTVLNLQKVIPEFEIWNLPFLFESNAHVFKYTDSIHAKNLLAKLDQFGITGVEYTYSGGFIDFYGKAFESFGELKGKTVGFEERSNSFTAFIEKGPLKIQAQNYGSLDDDIEYSEIISSTVDELIPMQRKKRKTLNVSKHRVFARVLFLSKEFLNKLSESDRQIVLAESESVAVMEREMAIGMTNVFRNTLSRIGTNVNYWSKDKRRLEKKRFLPMYEGYKKRFGNVSIEFIERNTDMNGVLNKVSEK